MAVFGVFYSEKLDKYFSLSFASEMFRQSGMSSLARESLRIGSTLLAMDGKGQKAQFKLLDKG